MKNILFIVLFWVGIISSSVMAQTIPLNSGVSQDGAADKDEYQHYVIHASAGDSIKVELYDQDADGDLYVKIDGEASQDEYNCKSDEGGQSNESCTIPPLAQDADIYIAVYAYKCLYNVQHTIKATVIGQDTVRLSSGVAKNGAADKKQYQHYVIHASAGDSVNVELYDQDADGDLYVKIGGMASQDDYDCKSDEGGQSNESCTIPPLAQDADIYIAVYAYKCLYNVQHTIKATVVGQNAVRLSSGVAKNGAADKDKYQHYVIHASAGDSVNVELYGQDADGDLYVKIGGMASQDDYDCKSDEGGQSNESCTIPPLAQDADIYIAVYAYKCIYNVQHTIKATINQGQNQHEYGKKGPFDIDVKDNERGDYTLYYPSNIENMDPKPPLVFIVAGGNSMTADKYQTLVRFIVSHGNAVLVSKGSFSPNDNTNRLEAGILAHNIQAFVDTSRIGVVGHSTGGANAFNVLKHFSAKGYGSNGKFIYSFDPFHMRMNEEGLQTLPSDTKVIVFQSTKDGKAPGPNETPKISLTIYSLLDSIPDANKDYQVFEHDGHSYISGGTYSNNDVANRVHVLKPLEALMAYTFKNIASAKPIALEVGSDHPISDNMVDLSGNFDNTYSGRCLVPLKERPYYPINSCNPQGL